MKEKLFADVVFTAPAVTAPLWVLNLNVWLSFISLTLGLGILAWRGYQCIVDWKAKNSSNEK